MSARDAWAAQSWEHQTGQYSAPVDLSPAPETGCLCLLAWTKPSLPESAASCAHQQRPNATAKRNAENNVTNPPFNSAKGFATSATQRARRKVALLLRLAFLEGANRASTIFAKTPPSRVWVFSERITFYASGVEPKGSGTTAYAWFKGFT